MDQLIVRRRPWRRVVPYAAIAILALAASSWLLLQQAKGHVYRLPLNRVTIATVAEGPFEDYIAVRGTVAPLITDFLTTDQGGTVKQVLVEDGATVKRGQKLIILSNPALQLQVAAQQITFEQTRFKYQHDLLEIDHQISQLKSNLTRDKILLEGNAIAPSTYQQELEDYNYNLKLREATVASRNVEQQVRATQLTGQQAGSQADIANAGRRPDGARTDRWAADGVGCTSRPVQGARIGARPGQFRRSIQDHGADR
jgi:HlyD family secretion protein